VLKYLFTKIKLCLNDESVHCIISSAVACSGNSCCHNASEYCRITLIVCLMRRYMLKKQ